MGELGAQVRQGGDALNEASALFGAAEADTMTALNGLHTTQQAVEQLDSKVDDLFRPAQFFGSSGGSMYAAVNAAVSSVNPDVLGYISSDANDARRASAAGDVLADRINAYRGRLEQMPPVRAGAEQGRLLSQALGLFTRILSEQESPLNQLKDGLSTASTNTAQMAQAAADEAAGMV